MMINFRLNKINGLRLVGSLIVPMVFCSAGAGAATIDAFASDGTTTLSADPNPAGSTTRLSVDFGSAKGLWIDMNEASTNQNEKITLQLRSSVAVSKVTVQFVKRDGDITDPFSGGQWLGFLSLPETPGPIDFSSDTELFGDPTNGVRGFTWGLTNDTDPGELIAINIDPWVNFGTGDWFLNIDLNDPDTTLANASFDMVPKPTSPVPLPGAVWLLGSGILGLAGVSRRRRNG